MSYKFLSTILGIDANFTGNVGVGTTTPAYKLDVAGTAKVSGISYLIGGLLVSNYGSTIAGGQSISGSGAGNYDFNNGSGGGWYFNWIQNGATAMRLSSGNNLLIGTTTDAGYKLDVNGTVRVTGAITTGIIGTAGTLNLNRSSDGANVGFVRAESSGAGIQIGAGINMFFSNNGRIVVNSTTTDASAIFKIDSTTQGVLLPRMTTTQRNAIATPATGLSIYNTTTNTEDYYNGSAWVSLQTSITNPVTGTGTTNYLSKWTSSSALGNSLVYDDGTNVGIGTTTFLGKFQVGSGSATQFQVASSGASIYVGPSSGNYNMNITTNTIQSSNSGTTNTYLYIQPNGTGNVAMCSSGTNKVLIGTTTDAGFKLDVNGTIRSQGKLTITTGGAEITGTAVLYSGAQSYGQVQIFSASAFQMFNAANNSKASFQYINANGLLLTTNSDNISGVLKGLQVNPTMVAAANNDVLVGLDITPTFTNGAFTGLTNLGLRVNSGVSLFSGNVVLNGTNLYFGSNLGNVVIRPVQTTNFQIFNNNSGATLYLNANGSVQIGQSNATNWATFSASGSTLYNTTTLPSLAGTGTRMVVADATGILSTQAVPTGTITGSGTTNYVSKWSSSSSLTNSVLYDDGTNVGIGTSSPAQALDVNGLIRTNRTSNTDGGLVFGTAGTYLYGADSGGYLATYTSNVERMRVTSSGNVGIGTTSPSGLLDVSTGSVNITSYAYGLDLKLSVAGGFARANRIYNSLATGLTSFFGGYGDSTSGVTRAYWTIGNQTDDTGYSYTSGIHLLYNGNVGIGTANPNGFATTGRTILSLNGASNTLIEFKVGDAFQNYIYSTTSTFELYSSSIIDFQSLGASRLRIASSGNVLVGTTTDNGAKLQVSGRASIYTGASVIDAVAFTASDGSNALNYIPYVGAGDYNNLSYGGGSLLFNNISSRFTVGTHNGTAIQFGPTDTIISGTTSMPNLGGSGTRMVVADSTGTLSTQSIPGGGSSYGSWQDNNTQTATTNNTGYGIQFNTTNFNSGVTVIPDSLSALTLIKFANAGKYDIQFSFQFQNTSADDETVYIWIRKNGENTPDDVPDSNTIISIPKKHGSGTPGNTVAAWNLFVDAAPNDFYQLVWATSNATDVTMQYYGATGFCPATPSAILTVNQVD